jgi:hypothetical protein
MADRLTDLMRAEAETLNIPHPPTEAILRDGRDATRRARAVVPSLGRGASERRRASVLVLAGVAASVVAVAGVVLSVTGTVPTANDVAPAPATTPPDPSDLACLRGMMESEDSEGPRCVPWPGTRGLKEALKVELLSADSVQKQAVQDNRVTQAEYRAGFERYRACLSDEGYQLGSVSQTDVVLDFAVPSEAVSSGADELCYMRHFKAVDMTWQMSHADATLSETNLRLINACLQDNGTGPAADIEQAADLMRDAGLTEKDCGLFPGQLDAVQD